MHIRWGILGTARINRSVIPAIRADPRSRLEAVASRSPDTAARYAAEWQIPRAFGSYDALLADPAIDAVYISIPNGVHVEWTIRALEAGKHVLCEKPLALTPGDVDRVADAARRTKRFAVEAFMYRTHPLTDAVLETLRRGDVGPVRAIRGAFTFVLARERDIRLDPRLGGGSLWDVGCYPVSYANLIENAAPLEVFAWQTTGPSGIDVAMSGQLRYASGVVAQFDCGFAAPFRAQMEIVCAGATAVVDLPFKTMPGSRLTIVRDGDAAAAVPFAADPPYIGEIQDLASAILDGAKPRVSLDESRRTVMTIVSLYESARTGAPVRLP
jgi:D-xylose 1-dehydrogenase (NADP+, D-xylono-1,5-lactone-forming)